MQLTRAVIAGAIGFAWLTDAQTIPLPLRAPNAPAGETLVAQTTSSPQAKREEEIFLQVLAGNVPNFLRRLCPVTVTNVTDGKVNSGTFFVAADYLAVGKDDDYFLTPLTPLTAQRIADHLGCTLPTPKMVDEIYTAAQVKLAPAPLPPGSQMTTITTFAAHNRGVRLQRAGILPTHPPGALVAGHKKDVVISAKLGRTPGQVAIYGWHQTNGTPIQPLYLDHTAAWVDYSHGIRLVQQKMIVNGGTKTVAEVLADPNLAGLLSDEGILTSPSYPTNAGPTGAAETHPPTHHSFPRTITEFKPTGHFTERSATFAYAPEVKVHINAPAPSDFVPDKPVRLILYALPNGNTTEQTIGHTVKPGDDWRFDIQHIGAQTRFLRELITNHTVVVAYLETEMKSWPAWRKKHGDGIIPEIVGCLKGIFPTNQIEIVLTGHSGGGSFTFGYLNVIERIPADVVRIAFLDGNYAYSSANHLAKLTRWLDASVTHSLCVFAYDDALALLDGKSFVSAAGGTWGRSHAMLRELGNDFPFTHQANAGLETWRALEGRIQFFLKANPQRQILHTEQVERNGFIHAMLTDTPLEGRGYEYFGARAYSKWILSR